MSYEPVKVGVLKVGRYVIEPESNAVCKILSIDKSKPGKHGAAKARIVLQDLFTGSKRQLVSPCDKRVNVPIIDKRLAQVTHVSDIVSVMDSETYETFEIPLPIEEELKIKISELSKSGKTIEIEYWVVMDKKKINSVREIEI